MVKKLILHIGHHKTGSTSLQLALRSAYESGALDDGDQFHYLKSGRGKTMAHHRLAKLITNPKMEDNDKGGVERG